MDLPLGMAFVVVLSQLWGTDDGVWIASRLTFCCCCFFITQSQRSTRERPSKSKQHSLLSNETCHVWEKFLFNEGQ